MNTRSFGGSPRLAVMGGLSIVSFLLIAPRGAQTGGSAAEVSRSTHPVAGTPPPKTARPSFGKVAPTFEENRGQASPEVKFLSRRSGSTVLLESTRIVTLVATVEARPSGDPALALAAGPRSETAVVYRPVTMSLVGSNSSAILTGVQEVKTKTNVYLGASPSGWIEGIPNFARVQAEAVYDGIDAEYHTAAGGAFEYDFVVAPGADAGAIALEFDGADSVSLDAEGSLLLSVDKALVKHLAPTAYQDGPEGREYVAASFEARSDSRYGFKVGAHDPARPLVIDPTTLLYSTFFGGGGNDGITAVAVDANGQACFAGVSTSAGPPFMVFAFLYGTAAMVAQLDAAGATLNWITILQGNAGGDDSRAIALDANGDVFACGVTQGAFPVTGGTFQGAYGGGIADGWVAKMNGGTGALGWATYLGGPNHDEAAAIAVGPNGTPFITGFTMGGFPTMGFGGPPNPTISLAYIGNTDAFVTQLNAAGNALVYSTYLGGTGMDNGRGIVVDANNRPYITGITASAGGPNPALAYPTTNGAYLTTFAGGATDLFVTCLNATATGFVYSTFLGGSGPDYNYQGMGIDSSGNAYVGGLTYSADYPTTGSAYQRQFGGGNTDGFLSQLDSTGSNLTYSTYLGGSGDEGVACTTADAGGNAYVTGATASTDFPVSGSAYQGTNAGNGDAFVVAFTSSLATVSSTYLGAAAGDYGVGIAVDGNGDMYVVGSTYSTGFPVTLGSYQGALSNGPDGFVCKMQ